jgi:prepilin-type N-terminal cleavage/methylation domain-containing protein
MTGVRRRIRRAPGFSLIEILIVVTLFSFASVILSQTYISFNRLHRKVSNAAVLAQDMRFATEFLVREARNKSINYPSYPDETTVASSTTIHLKGISDTTDIDIRTTECGDIAGVRCLAVSKDGGTTWSPITAKRVNVKSFNAFVRPTQSPFVPVSGSYPVSIQPFVTVNIALEYVADNPRDNTELQAQTTVSSRVYLR